MNTTASNAPAQNGAIWQPMAQPAAQTTTAQLDALFDGVADGLDLACPHCGSEEIFHDEDECARLFSAARREVALRETALAEVGPTM